ncbi:hypothetical protein CCMA1212_007732 [Trichoderma ghanense]|uniref:CTLH domain-containing protein n=1 Tax=Trichoderma ghanense TaxID=65468 RepID=A0ABY2GY00_9HYPO
MALTIDSDASLHVHLLEVLQNATQASFTSSNILAIPHLESKTERECILIRKRILSYLDIGDLNRAVHASPLLLQAFRPRRKQLLLCALFNTLGTTVLEAFAVYRTTSLESQASCDEEKVVSFLQALEQHRRRPSLTFELCTFFSEDDLVQMATFHNKVVRPHVQHLMSLETDSSNAGEPFPDERAALVRLSFYRKILHDALGLLQGQSTDLPSVVAGCGALGGDLGTGISPNQALPQQLRHMSDDASPMTLITSRAIGRSRNML